MSPFRRDRSAGPTEPDGTAGAAGAAGAERDFWQWWTETGAATCAAAIAEATVDSLVEEISARVEPLGEGLSWELAPGTRARHRLVVTAGGLPELRAAARRWLRAAPAPDPLDPDPTWEYADTRLPADVTELTLGVGEASLHLDDVRVGLTRQGYHLDVVVQHPLLATLEERDRMQVAFLALDTAIGEIDAETWIGSIEASADPLADPVALRDLPARVAQVRTDAVAEDGAPTWVLLHAEGDNGPVMAAAMVPLAPSVAPHLDLHLLIDVPYAGRGEEGLPDPDALEALRGLEDHLSARLGDSALLVAHETTYGHRLLHFYADSTGPVEAMARAAVGAWPDGAVHVVVEPDPGWNAVRDLRA